MEVETFELPDEAFESEEPEGGLEVVDAFDVRPGNGSAMEEDGPFALAVDQMGAERQREQQRALARAAQEGGRLEVSAEPGAEELRFVAALRRLVNANPALLGGAPAFQRIRLAPATTDEDRAKMLDYMRGVTGDPLPADTFAGVRAELPYIAMQVWFIATWRRWAARRALPLVPSPYPFMDASTDPIQADWAQLALRQWRNWLLLRPAGSEMGEERLVEGFRAVMPELTPLAFNGSNVFPTIV